MRFYSEKFKKLGDPALNFGGAVLEIGTCRGMLGTILSRIF